MAAKKLTTAMILAAGRGERMRPLTDKTPKPLLTVHGTPLICWHLQKLAAAGIEKVVINLAHLGQQIIDELGDGQQFGLQICYSPESEALETAGGIVNALPLLGAEDFLLVNGDVWCDVDFSRFTPLHAGLLAHLLMVNNPSHNLDGDFPLCDGQLHLPTNDVECLTYSGIGVYSTQLFAPLHAGKQPLAPVLKQAIREQRVAGQLHQGVWCDVGTPERLAALNQQGAS